MTEQLARDLNSAASLIGLDLCRFAEVDDAMIEIDLVPAKRKDRFLASAGVEGEQDK